MKRNFFTKIATIMSVCLLLVAGCASKQDESKTESSQVKTSPPPKVEVKKTAPANTQKQTVKKEPVKVEKPAEPIQNPITESPKMEKVAVINDSPAPLVEKKQEPEKEEVAKVVEEPKVESTPEPQPEPVKEEVAQEDDEYTRSVSKVKGSITKETFEEDKKEILAIIDKLADIMKSSDYQSWLSYVDSESKTYWSNRTNLQKAAARRKGLQLNYLRDYFLKVFVPARKGRRIDEIRYETESSVKAVQVNGSNDTIFYDFQKENGVWKVHLPPISD